MANVFPGTQNAFAWGRFKVTRSTGQPGLSSCPSVETAAPCLQGAVKWCPAQPLPTGESRLQASNPLVHLEVIKGGPEVLFLMTLKK